MIGTLTLSDIMMALLLCSLCIALMHMLSAVLQDYVDLVTSYHESTLLYKSCLSNSVTTYNPDGRTERRSIKLICPIVHENGSIEFVVIR